MRVIEITAAGGPDVLKQNTREKPKLSPRDILIKVAYAGVNRPDCLQRAGQYAPPPGASDLPGLEVSGEVVATGRDAKFWNVGDKVCALTAGGGYAEYVSVHESNALKIPENLSLLEAAALPENYFTVWSNLFERGKLKKGECVLIHGGSSGIGTTAIQMAKAFGAIVYTTVGTKEKKEACLALGADFVYNYRTQDFVQEILQETQNKGVEVILDMVGGDYIAKNHQVAALEGRIVQIAFLEGGKVTFDFRPLMMKRLTHTGSTLRPQSIQAKASIARALEKHIWPLLTSHTIKPLIDTVFPLEEAAKAHAIMEKSHHIGKIMLKVN
jgi:NADPH:quinone reductase